MRYANGWIAGAIVALAAAQGGCSDSKTNGADGGVDGGAGGSDAGRTTADASTSGDSGSDAGGATPTACTQADFDAADFRQFGQVDVSVRLPDGGTLQFVNKCAKISVGQKAEFAMGDFSIHPLAPLPSTPTNPIPRTASGTQNVIVTFPAAGTFGFICENHTTMKGAIQVVP